MRFEGVFADHENYACSFIVCLHAKEASKTESPPCGGRLSAISSFRPVAAVRLHRTGARDAAASAPPAAPLTNAAWSARSPTHAPDAYPQSDPLSLRRSESRTRAGLWP